MSTQSWPSSTCGYLREGSLCGRIRTYAEHRPGGRHTPDAFASCVKRGGSGLRAARNLNPDEGERRSAHESSEPATCRFHSSYAGRPDLRCMGRQESQLELVRPGVDPDIRTSSDIIDERR